MLVNVLKMPQQDMTGLYLKKTITQKPSAAKSNLPSLNFKHIYLDASLNFSGISFQTIC